MKRREVDKRLTQLLDRIDGELAEIRDGLIEVDHRAGSTGYIVSRLDVRTSVIEARLQAFESYRREHGRD